MTMNMTINMTIIITINKTINKRENIWNLENLENQHLFTNICSPAIKLHVSF
jgi:hypothetical protein